MEDISRKYCGGVGWKQEKMYAFEEGIYPIKFHYCKIEFDLKGDLLSNTGQYLFIIPVLNK